MTTVNRTISQIATEMIKNAGPAIVQSLQTLNKILELLAPFITFVTWAIGEILARLGSAAEKLAAAAMYLLGISTLVKKATSKFDPKAAGYLDRINRFFNSFVRPGPPPRPPKPPKPPRPPRPPRPPEEEEE